MQDYRFFPILSKDVNWMIMRYVGVGNMASVKFVCKNWKAASDSFKKVCQKWPSDKFLAWIFDLSIHDTHTLLEKCQQFANCNLYGNKQSFDIKHYGDTVKELIITRQIPLPLLLGLCARLTPDPAQNGLVRCFTRFNLPCLSGLTMRQISA